MKVRHAITRLGGNIIALRTLPVEQVGDQAGEWFNVVWDDGFQSWVQASSVEVLP